MKAVIMTDHLANSIKINSLLLTQRTFDTLTVLYVPQCHIIYNHYLVPRLL